MMLIIELKENIFEGYKHYANLNIYNLRTLILLKRNTIDFATFRTFANFDLVRAKYNLVPF